MLSSDSSLGMWATDGGRTQVPGFLVHLVNIPVISLSNQMYSLQNDEIKIKNFQPEI
jgi:hypothetical protein